MSLAQVNSALKQFFLPFVCKSCGSMLQPLAKSLKHCNYLNQKMLLKQTSHDSCLLLCYQLKVVTIPWNTCIQNLQGQLRKEERGKSLALARVLPWWCTEFGKTILMQSASTTLQLVVASTCSVWFPALHPLQTQNISCHMLHVCIAWLLIMTGRLVLHTLWA